MDFDFNKGVDKVLDPDNKGRHYRERSGDPCFNGNDNGEHTLAPLQGVGEIVAVDG